MKTRVRVIAGPTASGKSARALEIAEQCGGVIINADSMQVYDALPVLTAQPTQDDCKKAPHTLYGVLHPNENCTAARWRAFALSEIERAEKKKQTPVICGGTGFYVQALIDGFSPVPGVPAAIRENVMRMHESLGAQAFHEKLAQIDPDSSGRLHPNDTQRVLRAYEVFEATGKTLSFWQAQPKEKPPAHLEFEIETILPDRETLNKRIEKRFDAMIENGALEEVREFASRIDDGEIIPDTSVTNALGFHELRAILNGEISRDQAIELAKIRTRQYARRQMTWIRTQLSGAKKP